MYQKLARLCDSTDCIHIFVLKGQDTLYVGTKLSTDFATDKILWRKYDVKTSKDVYELMGIWVSERVVSFLMENK